MDRPPMAVGATPPVRSGAVGAVKVIGPCSGIPANHNNSIAIDCKPPAHAGV